MPPEMVKTRPVVVVSSKESHARGVCTVVPLSTTQPHPAESWHCEIRRFPVPGFQTPEMMWAKCDMVSTVGFVRLHQPYIRSRSGRIFRPTHMAFRHMQLIGAGLLAHLKL